MKNKTVMRTFEILELIAKYPDGVVLTDLVKELDIPKSTIHDILQALVATGSIYFKDERVKSYAIGPNIYALGGAYSRTSNLINVSRPYMEEVCELIHQPLMLSKLVGSKIVYVYKEEPGDIVLKTPSLGVINEGRETTVGQLLIAFAEKDYEDSEASFGIMDEAYKEDLEEIRKKGYKIGIGIEGLHTICIAVPIFNVENKIGGVLSSVGIYLPNSDFSENLKLLKDRAEKISYRLGYNRGI